jgi:hypothetical protein
VGTTDAITLNILLEAWDAIGEKCAEVKRIVITSSIAPFLTFTESAELKESPEMIRGKNP